ncbi:MAG: BamA/TamA family outer membrane protein [Sorangiineae bacterium]|nr:BamA/TamA family outer membrane protein [Polyangiaceae bacterium]MEB2321048.1 BamA/TamA family outer membrane protein [Sorangiineae bacterium]
MSGAQATRGEARVDAGLDAALSPVSVATRGSSLRWPLMVVALLATLTTRAVHAQPAAAEPAEEPAPPAATGAPDTWGSGAPAPAPEPSTPPAPEPPPAVSPPLAAPDEPDASAPSSVRYTLEGIELRGNTKTRPRVVLRYVPFRPGDIIDVDDPEVELTRYRLLGTGFFREVQFSLKRGTRRGYVVLVIDVVERNTIIVNDLWMGLSADADNDGRARPLTAYAGVDVAETNLAGTGITLGTAIGLAQDQLALRVRFLDPAFLGSSWMTSGTLLFNDARDFFGNRDVFYSDGGLTSRIEDYATVQYERFGGSLGAGRDLSVATQLWVSYRLEAIDARVPVASHLRGLDREPIDFHIDPGRSVLSTVRATLQYDSRDHPFLPTRGWYGNFAAETGVPPSGSDYDYQRFDVSLSRWWELPWAHVVHLELFGGAIAGNAPFFEQYYVGDFTDFLPARVLGLNFDRRPPPNFLHTDIGEVRYGDYALKLGGEYRIPLYRGHRSVYGIDFFTSAGIYGVASRRDITSPPRGYGAAARIPIDLTANLGFRMDTSAGGFVFAFSNVLGFIPARHEAAP